MQGSEHLSIRGVARGDLIDIWLYTDRQWGETQANHYIEGIFKTCDRIIDGPKLGRNMPELGDKIRMLPYEKHVIFYSVGARDVVFLAFLHARQDLLAHLKGRL